jgi:pyruvate dehydrogenase E2 component (dihydrolipoamide acetyltransferase)
MAEFRMPSLGADMIEGTVLEWLVAPGDIVRRGDIVAVVDTDKAEMDVESFEDGLVERLLVPIGSKVPVGAPLAVFAAALAKAPASVMAPTPAVAPAPTPAVAPAPEIAPVREGEAAPSVTSAPLRSPAGVPVVPVSPPVRRLARRLGVDLAAVQGAGPGGRIRRQDVEAAIHPGIARPSAPPLSRPDRVPRQRVSPYARRLASDLGVDVGDLAGTGRGGAVVAADVLHAAARRDALTPPVAGPPTPAVVPPTAPRTEDRAAARRRAIADLMARSNREIPHFYLATTIDLGRVMAHLATLNAERPVFSRLVPAALLLKAAALAAQRVPQVNGSWTDNGFVPAEHVHLGVAVSLHAGGLLVPAIHDADTLALDELMTALRDVVQRARTGRLHRTEMAEGTLTVTSLGDRGVDSVHGVIYPPQVALVGFGRVVDRPWAIDGMLAVRPVVTASLAADHRAIDGHLGGLFLSAIEDLLACPEEL